MLNVSFLKRKMYLLLQQMALHSAQLCQRYMRVCEAHHLEGSLENVGALSFSLVQSNANEGKHKMLMSEINYDGIYKKD